MLFCFLYICFFIILNIIQDQCNWIIVIMLFVSFLVFLCSFFLFYFFSSPLSFPFLSFPFLSFSLFVPVSLTFRLPGPTSRVSTAGSDIPPRGQVSSSGNRRSQGFSDKTKGNFPLSKGRTDKWTWAHWYSSVCSVLITFVGTSVRLTRPLAAQGFEELRRTKVWCMIKYNISLFSLFPCLLFHLRYKHNCLFCTN